MLTRKSSSALLRQAPDEETAYEILRAYVWSKIQRGNSQKSLLKKVDAVKNKIPQQQLHEGAHRRLRHTLNGARLSWSGKSIEGYLAEVEPARTQLGVQAWERAAGSRGKYAELLSAMSAVGHSELDEEDEWHSQQGVHADAGWRPQMNARRA